ncbi:MAG TPA: ABC transporter permease [Usitatibacter sp.]|nr:ABC transporter permease [Usitatibacter sp.]
MSTSRSELAAAPAGRWSARLRAWSPGAERLTQAASILGGLVIWELVASQYSSFILPPPSAVLRRLLDTAFDMKLLVALYGALQHMLAGFALAVAVAVPLGIMMGRMPRLNAMLDPIVSALYAIPAVAFVPFLVIWFGLFFESRMALVFIMAFPDMLVVIVAGARDIKRNLFAVGRSFGASPAQIALKVTLPAMLPFLMTAFRVGIARAINGMITAELFLAAVNLGAMMKASARTFDSTGLLTVVVVVCLLGLAAQSLIAALERRFLHWHHRP